MANSYKNRKICCGEESWAKCYLGENGNRLVASPVTMTTAQSSAGTSYTTTASLINSATYDSTKGKYKYTQQWTLFTNGTTQYTSVYTDASTFALRIRTGSTSSSYVYDTNITDISYDIKKQGNS